MLLRIIKVFVRIGEALRSRVRVRVENKKKGLGCGFKRKDHQWYATGPVEDELSKCLLQLVQ